jgi:SAM-dependent methyltransferase
MVMSESARDKSTWRTDGLEGTVYKRDFWSQENLNYSRPHFRMEKIARLINQLARGRECKLLDVGCGPATLMSLLRPNIEYFGIDIAIHDPQPNLIEVDFLEDPISFNGRRFDIIVAQGVFEYVGRLQSQKFAEIAELLTEDGIFVVSYVNFDHRQKQVFKPYSNVQPFSKFRTSLAEHFRVLRFFPTSYNWGHWEPGRKLLKAANINIRFKIPLIDHRLAVEYILICSARKL